MRVEHYSEKPTEPVAPRAAVVHYLGLMRTHLGVAATVSAQFEEEHETYSIAINQAIGNLGTAIERLLEAVLETGDE